MSIPPAADLSTALGGPPARRGAVGLRRCHDCDLLVEVGAVPPGSRARCGRCGALLFAHKKDPARRAPRALRCRAGAVGGLQRIPVHDARSSRARSSRAACCPGALSLYNDGLWQLALLVLLFVIVFPLGKILMNLAVLAVRAPGTPPALDDAALPLVETLHPWAMTEVFLLGVLVAYAKLLDLASIEIGPSMIAFVGADRHGGRGRRGLRPERRLGPRAAGAAGADAGEEAARRWSAATPAAWSRVPPRTATTTTSTALPALRRADAPAQARTASARTWALLIGGRDPLHPRQRLSGDDGDLASARARRRHHPRRRERTDRMPACGRWRCWCSSPASPCRC